VSTPTGLAAPPATRSRCTHDLLGNRLWQIRALAAINPIQRDACRVAKTHCICDADQVISGFGVVPGLWRDTCDSAEIYLGEF
jgi:hypothetical protein